MNLGDPELELIDPSPNIHSLFIHFDKVFFSAKLNSRAVVRWSKRMYSCAGVCSYEGRGGLCDIALSEPLLKLRPRKDLVETLLHEMIHAYLFVTCRDQDRDGHGPNFQAHMHRINKCAGLNISIYHSFHDEVELYQTHWWRCNGPCQTRKPHFGIVRRSCNRAPGPSDYWWNDHKRKCGGTFTKIKEPDKKVTKKARPKADITKYINNNTKIPNKNISQTTQSSVKSILKDSSNVPTRLTKPNNSSTVIVTQKSIASPKVQKKVNVFTGDGYVINKSQITTQKSVNVVETVRSMWANKQLPSTPTSQKEAELKNKVEKPKPILPKSNTTDVQSPPKQFRIDDYFKRSANFLLKEVYGVDMNIKVTENSNKKIIAVKNEICLVDCPICNTKVSSDEINRHIDECLNKDVIEQLSKNNERIETLSNAQCTDRKMLKGIVGDLPSIPPFKAKSNKLEEPVAAAPLKTEVPFVVDLTHVTNRTEDIPTLPNKIQKSEGQNKNYKHDTPLHPKVTEITQPCDKNTDRRKRSRKSDNYYEDVRRKISKPTREVSIGDGVPKKLNMCPCCGGKFEATIKEHLDMCLMFFYNNTTMPIEGASTSFLNETIVVDDDNDIFDESQTLNATGTKTPCPCCLEMTEESDMNDHLDNCLK